MLAGKDSLRDLVVLVNKSLRFLKKAEISDFADKNRDYTDQRPLEVFQRSSLKRGKKMQGKIGFTIIELLVVVAIIAMITAIAVPNLMSTNIRAKIKGINSDMEGIAIALEDYKIDNEDYPHQYDSNYDKIATVKPLTKDNARGLGKLVYPTTSDSTPVYLTSIPKDPFNNNEEPGGYYSYFTTGDSTPTSWALVSYGPDKDGDITNYDGAKNAVNNGTNLYNPDSGITSGGDIVITGP